MNYKSLLLVILVFTAFSRTAESQNKYYVYFKDKNGVSFDPYAYFDQKTIERRNKHGIPLDQFSDKPVSEKYLSSLSPFVDSIKMASRWLNMAVVSSSPEKLEEIKRLSFVKKVDEPFPIYVKPASVNEKISDLSDYEKALAYYQTERMKGSAFKKNNLNGSGVRIAIFDAGFIDADKNSAFQHLRENNRIIKTWDFVKNRENVYKYMFHGTSVLSCIAGKLDTLNLGLATEAEFILARTERVLVEPFSEEENWLAAAEWADKNGADIINSSLGYTVNRYFPKDMNGHESLVSKAARMATRKGILVVNSAGNEGSESWNTVGTPADVDSVLSVGGTDPATDAHIGFSSFGPVNKKIIKPNVCAYGTVLSAKGKGFAVESGTSFSSPLVAGFAACVLQEHPDYSNMELFNAIEHSAHLYPYFDYAHGYGIPQADYFTGRKDTIEPTVEIKKNDKFIQIIIKDKFCDSVYVNDNGKVIRNPKENEKLRKDYRPVGKNFYYHIANKKGELVKYAVIRPDSPVALSINKYDYPEGFTLMFHFEGYTSEIKF